MAKIKRARHPRRDTEAERSTEFGQLVASDLVGPTRPSYDGMVYLQAIMGDCTSWEEAYPTKDKFPTSTAKNWQLWQAGRSPDRECRTDNGGEFEREFHDLLLTNGTEHSWSTPQRPGFQQPH